MSCTGNVHQDTKSDAPGGSCKFCINPFNVKKHAHEQKCHPTMWIAVLLVSCRHKAAYFMLSRCKRVQCYLIK